MRTQRAATLEPQKERARVLADLLEERRREIRGEMEALAADLRRSDAPEGGDEAERAVHSLTRELTSAHLERLGRMLRQVDEALERHARRAYGRCLGCQRDIPVARLRSLPFAVYCRPCQEAVEAGIAPGVEMWDSPR